MEHPPGAEAAASGPSRFNTKEVKWWRDVVNECDTITSKRKHTPQIQHALKAYSLDEQAHKLGACASHLHFRHWLEDQATVLRSANFCQQPKLCRNCGFYASLGTARDYYDRTEHLLEENKDLVPFMFTFTIQDGRNLKERLGTLREGLKKMRQRRRDSGRNSSKLSEWQKIHSAAIRIEIKRGKNSGLWHPHAHAIVLRKRGEYFDLSQMQKDWSHAVGKGNIDVRPTSAGLLMLKMGAEFEQVRGNLAQDMLEIFKYITKFSECTAQDLVDIYLATYRMNLTYNWGGFNGLKDKLATGDVAPRIGEYLDIIAMRDQRGKYHFHSPRTTVH